MNKRYKFLKLIQGKNNFYTILINVNELLEIYYVDYYDSINNPEGYQRPIQQSHRKKIVNYLLDEESPIINTPIIAAINLKDLIINNDEIEFNNKIRIVDGQHRLEAFKKLKEDQEVIFNNKFSNYTLMLTIIPTEEERLIEIETFININNKNKRVSTTLAENLLEKIRKAKIKDLYNENIKINSEEIEELISSISYRVVEKINNDNMSIWYNCIKMGDCNNNGKIISVNAFINSILPIVREYIKVNKNSSNIINIDNIINEVIYILNSAWRIIEEKWPEAIGNNKYNIQKGIGVYPLHHLLGECIVNDKKNSISNFNKIIKESSVISDDWYLGGKFSSFNSKAGFKKIEEYLKEK